MTIVVFHRLAPRESAQLERLVAAIEKLTNIGTTPEDPAQLAALAAEMKAHDDAAAAALHAAQTPSA